MKVFLVGGAVRDKLLGFPFKEKDWVVVGASPEQMLEAGYRPVGKDFPVFLHPQTNEEYALARTERKTAPGYKGFVFHTDTQVTLEEDLLRRDLTINAMAENDEGNIIDPYKGQEDLNNKILRHVSAAFAEDPVRLLRTARFAARYHHLGFGIADETNELMQTMVEQKEAQYLVAERVWQEFYKALLEKNPAVFFTSLQNAHALTDIFPELDNEMLDRNLENLTTVANKTQNPEQRFTGLCANIDSNDITALCERLSTPHSFSTIAILFVKNQAQILLMNNQSTEDIASFFLSVDALRKPERFLSLIEICAYLYNVESLTHFWSKALAAYNKVNIQALVKQGYEKAALGEAIKNSRIQSLEKFLTHYA
jgi:tRNA nucleotidyltransferase (CCA-adding enzyme)